MMTMSQVDAELARVSGEINRVNAEMAARGRSEYTPDEMVYLEDLLSQGETLQAHKRQLQADAIAARASQPVVNLPSPGNNWNATSGPLAGRPSVSGGTLASAHAPDHGWGSFGNFLGALKRQALGMGTDQRLYNSVSTLGTTQDGPSGGFAAPPEYAATISQVVMGEGSLVQRFSPVITGSGQVIYPVDETTAHGTSGIVAGWYAEGSTFTDKKPLLAQRTVTLQKAGVLVQLSDELVSDAPAIQQHVMLKIAEALAGTVNEAIVAGTGVAQPLGLKNAPGKITQAKSTAGVTSLQARDVLNMLSRLPTGAQRGAFWLCHNSVLPEIHALTFGTASTPLFTPDFRSSPAGKLLGLDIVSTEYCQSVNAAAGDIYLVAPSGYLLAVHSSGLRTAASIHMAFAQDLSSFRATYRVGGTPLASAPISRKNGALTLSHIIDLAVRS